MCTNPTAIGDETKANIAATDGTVKDSEVQKSQMFSSLCSEIIDITVGSGKQLLRIHKKIICDKVPSLAERINTEWSKANGMIDFPEYNAHSFQLLMNWVYFGSLPTLKNVGKPGKNPTFNWSFCILYKLAHELVLVELQDLVMDHLYDLYKEDMRIGPSLLGARAAYDCSVEGARLRLFVVRHLRLGLLKASPKWYSAEKFYNFMRENEDIGKDLVQSLQAMKDESDEHPKCDYHIHAKGEVCPYTSNVEHQKRAAFQPFLQTMGTEMVELTVGPNKQIFRVHKKFLCDKLDYFACMFGTEFLEAKNGTADFPEDKEEAFELLLEWMYFGKLPTAQEDKPEMKLDYFDLYELADKFCIVELKDKIMDNLLHEYLRTNILILEEAVRAYHITPDGSPLRKYASRAVRTWIAIAHTETQKNNILTVMNMHDDLGRDVLTLIQNDPKGLDPRMRPKCHYHHHRDDEDCPYLS